MSVPYAKIVKQQLNRRLREFGFDPKTFLADLAATDARITGSFALQVILGETFSDSDLDIFCHQRDHVKLHESHILSKNYTWIAPPKKETDNEDESSDDDSKGNYEAQEGVSEPSLADIVKVQSYSYQGKKVQFVIIKDSVPIMDHIDKFDISFCKVSFDGKKFNVPNSKNTLQKIGFIPFGFPIRQERVAKYKARGFKIYQEL
jgi:hypothetical protein